MMNPTPSRSDLLHYLQSDDPQQRQAAAIELSRIQDEAIIPALLTALEDSDSTVRANAAAGLGHNRAQDAFSALITMLRHDPEDIVRERAATALAQIGDERAIDPLIDALDDSSAWTRNRIIYLLGASRDARAVEPLLEQLDSREPSTQGVAAWALGAIGDQRALDALRGLLRSTHASVRGNVAWALGEFGLEALIADLLPLLADAAPEVRAKTAWALGAISEATGNVEMFDALSKLLDDFAEAPGAAAHIFVCQYAAEALSQMNHPQAQQIVEAWRPIAREKLLPRRIADVLRNLRHKDPQIRDEMLRQVVEIGSPAVDLLVQALHQHEHERVRQGVAQALGMIADSRAAHALVIALADADPGVWSQATAALANLGKGAEKALRPAISSKTPRVRQGAAIALWRIQREEKAFTILLQAIQDEELLVRSSAISSLWTQPDERAVATLQIQLQNESGTLAHYILQALQMIGTPAAQATIAHWMSQHR
jgi:HEAT repeat protein